MAKSTVPFERWTCREHSSWPFQVFKKYNAELDEIWASHAAASKFTYKSLGKLGASWDEASTTHLTFRTNGESEAFATLKDWSKAFNDFGNWTRLNTVIAITSNLETFMAAAIRLAIESDPGVLLGAPRAIDGILFLKRDTPPLRIEEAVTSCTKGDWNSRIAAYKQLFGAPPAILTAKISDLEDIRQIRNRIGHAFGRDITAARQHGVREIIPMERIAEDRALRYQRVVWSVAKNIDIHLLSNHIGEYQAIRFYHELYPKLSGDVHPHQRAIIFKKELGRFKAGLAGKQFCNGLVTYYEGLR